MNVTEEHNGAAFYNASVEQLWQNKMFTDEQNAIDTASSLDDLAAVEFVMQTEEARLRLLRRLVSEIDSRDLAVMQETITEEESQLDQLHLVLHHLRT